MPPSRPLAERFWEKVDKTPGFGPWGDCWRWTGAVTSRKRGSIAKGVPDQGTMTAHRASWVLHFGEPAGDLQVLHRCDVTICVNPGHLWLGDHDMNMLDMAVKERSRETKLTASEVEDIRQMHIFGHISQSVIAAQYGVSQSAISRAVRGKNWAHVVGPTTGRKTRRGSR